MPIRRLIAIACLGVIISLAIGCEDDSVTTLTSTQVEFPNGVGDRWTFYFYDSLQELADTVDIEVTGIGLTPQGKQAKVWVLNFRHLTDSLGAARVDTMLVREAGDTVFVYRTRLPSVISFVYPLLSGHSWTSDPDRVDTSTVVSILPTMLSPMGQLANVRHIERKWTELVVGAENSEIWLAPGVGLAAMRLNYMGLMPPAELETSEVWIMLAFDEAG